MDMRLHKGLEKRILDGLEDFSKYYVLNNQSKELIEGHFNLTSSMLAVNILNQHELNNGRSPKYKTVEFIPGKEIKKNNWWLNERAKIMELIDDNEEA
jgi:cell division protein YceG involved in septum cleavage